MISLLQPSGLLLLLRATTQFQTSAAAPAANLSARFSPNPIPDDFQAQTLIFHERPRPEAIDVMTSALRSMTRLSMRPYQAHVEREDFRPPSGSNVKISSYTRADAPRPYENRYAMWAIDACIGGYMGLHQPWFETQCDIGFEDDPHPLGNIAWVVIDPSLSSSNSSIVVQKRQRQAQSDSSTAQPGADDIDAHGVLASEAGFSLPNTTSSAATNGAESAEPYSDLKPTLGRNPEVSLRLTNYGVELGRDRIFGATYLTVIDRASRRRTPTVRGSYSYKSRRDRVDITFKPKADVPGQAVAYETVVKAISLIPRVMIRDGDQFRECDLTVFEDDVVVGEGSVRRIRAGGGVLDG